MVETDNKLVNSMLGTQNTSNGERRGKGEFRGGKAGFLPGCRGGLVQEVLPEGERGMLEDQREVREPGDSKVHSCLQALPLDFTILNVCPQVGDSVMVLPTIPEEEAKKLFPKGVFTKELPSGKKYLRYTPQP